MKTSTYDRPHKVGIGLCTYKRPEQLALCLQSLNQLIKPQGIDWCLLIADNDKNSSAKGVVEDFRSQSQFPIFYVVETSSGIAATRNAVLKLGVEQRISELAFIDDDETVDPNWLAHSWLYYQSMESDVVTNRVITLYPHNTPEWIKKGKFYDANPIQTGQLMYSAATGNVLFNFQKIVAEYQIFFDEDLGASGGEDTEFFLRVRQAGMDIKGVSNAIVYEMLDPSRFSLRYLLKRNFMTQNSRVRYKYKNNVGKIRLLFYSCFQVVKGVLFIFPGGVLGRVRIYKGLVDLVSGFGRIMAFFGIHLPNDLYA